MRATTECWVLVSLVLSLHCHTVAAEHPSYVEYDLMVEIADAITHAQKSADPAMDTRLSLGVLLRMLPDHLKQEFATMFPAQALEKVRALSLTPAKVQSAVQTAQQYSLNNNNPHMLDLELCALRNLTGSALRLPVRCNVASEMRTLAADFAVTHQFVAQAEGMGTRPGVREQSVQSILVKGFFWLSYCMSFVYPLVFLIKQAWRSRSSASSATRLGMEEAQAASDKWDLILAAFPNAQLWKAANRDSREFNVLVRQLCEGHVLGLGPDKGEMSDDDLEQCWERKRREKHSKDTSMYWSSQQTTLPEAITCFFALALLLRESAAQGECTTLKDVRERYACTNGSHQGSICAIACEDYLDAHGKLVRQVVDRTKSPLMVCGASGEWYGGPEDCIRLPSSDLPLLASTRQGR